MVAFANLSFDDLQVLFFGHPSLHIRLALGWLYGWLIPLDSWKKEMVAIPGHHFSFRDCILFDTHLVAKSIHLVVKINKLDGRSFVPRSNCALFCSCYS